MNFIKKFLKTLFVLLIIVLIGFCGYRFYTLKKEGKLKEVFAKDENNINQSYYGKDYSESSSSVSSKNNNDDEKNNKSENSDGKYVVEEKNYDGYYNQFYFDSRLLLYEGLQTNQGVVEAFNLLIMDATDPMFSKPEIIFNNFNNLEITTITESNLTQYEDVLKAAKAELGNSGSCSFEFEYNSLKTHVNKIIIEKH